MSFLSRAANLDFIQTNRTIIWPLTSSFAILSFLNNPHLIGVPVSHISKNIFKKETWVWRGVLSWRERQLLQSSSICSHATIEVFRKRELAGLEWNRPHAEKGGGDVWWDTSWHHDPRHPTGGSAKALTEQRATGSRKLQRKRNGGLEVSALTFLCVSIVILV